MSVLSCYLSSLINITYEARSIVYSYSRVVETLCREHGKLVSRSTRKTQSTSDRIEHDLLIASSVDTTKVKSLLPVDEDPNIICSFGYVDEKSCASGVNKV